jgi:glutamate synthase (NADPH/NADH) small chain
MGDPKGFLKTARETARRRAVDVRLTDWREVYEPFARERAERQAARCMDCGIPFCHHGCPLGNLIPEWNDLVYRSDWTAAADRLHATNNFPEFTGRLCPAPCESACVLGINAEPVTIKQVEVEIIDRAWASGDVVPLPPESLSGLSVAVVGSGPAGLAAAQQLTRAGHAVTVFERDDAPGGLLRYGIPEFKMEKRHLDRRLAQMADEGTRFECGVGVDSAAQLDGFSAVVLAGGARVPRDLPVPGRDLAGIYQAMEYLPPANKHSAAILRGVEGGSSPLGQAEASSPVTAAGKHVVIIGGGDTGADCLGTAHRQGARSVTQLEIMPKPPRMRAENQPWPTYPMIYRVSSAHEEGGERVYAVSTEEFLGDDSGAVRALRLTEVAMSGGRFSPVPGTQREIPCELVLFAMGFTGAERPGLLSDLGVEFDARGNVARSASYETSVPGVFVAGDMGRGQSLIVWAIAEGRSAAAHVDKYLRALDRPALPVAIPPTARPLVLPPALQRPAHPRRPAPADGGRRPETAARAHQRR